MIDSIINNMPFGTANALGDQWSTISFLYRISEAISAPIDMGQYYYSRYSHETITKETYKLTKEILPLFDTKGKINLIDQAAKTLLPWTVRFAYPYLKTKIKWNSKKTTNIVCFQFNAKSQKKLVYMDNEQIEKIQSFLKKLGYRVQKLGFNQSIEDIVNCLSTCTAFVGVDSGMSHIAHSVGAPIFMIANNRLLFSMRNGSHYKKQQLYCSDINDFIKAFSEFHQTKYDYYYKYCENY